MDKNKQVAFLTEFREQVMSKLKASGVPLPDLIVMTEFILHELRDEYRKELENKR